MSTNLVWLAILMFAVTYPSRALGLLAPAMDRLPKVVLDYLQLVGPAVLAALAAVAVMVTTEEGGATDLPRRRRVAGPVPVPGPRRVAEEPVPRARGRGDPRGRGAEPRAAA